MQMCESNPKSRTGCESRRPNQPRVQHGDARVPQRVAKWTPVPMLDHRELVRVVVVVGGVRRG